MVLFANVTFFFTCLCISKMRVMYVVCSPQMLRTVSTLLLELAKIRLMSAERLKSKVARNSRIELSLHTFNEFLYTLNNTIKTLQLNTSKLEVATRGEPKAVQAVRAELSTQPGGGGCPALTAAPHPGHTHWPWGQLVIVIWRKYKVECENRNDF